jgi:predicted nucleic acid-binding protein
MGTLNQLIAYRTIGLDTSVFIYHLEAHPDYQKITHNILFMIEDRKFKAFTSAITLMEINVRPLKLGRDDIARKYEALFINYPNLSIVDIDRDVARLAAKLRAGFNIRPAGALKAAACLAKGSKAFITNDHTLKRLEALFPVFLLDDLVRENNKA